MNSKLEIKKTKSKGRGVFAVKSFKKGEVIEECPVILLSKKDMIHCEKTLLEKYIYEWKENGDGAVALGYGSLYNHGFNPNAEYEFVYSKKLIVYKALRSIKKGEEVVVNYNGNMDNNDPIDFEHPRRYQITK